jgi:hypothetical protein
MQRSPNDLLNRYLQAVGFWLPRKQKEDILAELSEDLCSQIEDREAELDRSLQEAEVAAILKRRGRPELVAGSFLPQKSLIGPVLYPIYIFVLKIIAACMVVPWLISLGFVVFNHVQGGLHLPVPLPSVGTLWTVVFIQFGVVTLTFAVIERVWKGTHLLGEWDPLALPKVKVPQSSKRRSHAAAELIFSILGSIWLIAVPKFPFLILGPGAYGLQPAPIWATVYPLILLLAIAGMLEHAVTLIRPQLTWLGLVWRVVTNIGALWVVYRLLQTRIYLSPVDPHFAQYASIANPVALICVAGAGLGLTIGLFFNAWKAVREILHSTRPVATRLA